MDQSAALTAVMLLVDLLGGAMVGVFTSASAVSVREDQVLSLTTTAPDPLCEGGRGFYGVYIRGSGFVSDTLRDGGTGEQSLDEDEPGDNSDQDAHGQEPDR